MVTERILNYQADIIEWTLANFGLKVRIIGGIKGARLTEFHLLLAPGQRLNRLLPLADDIALALGVASCHLSKGPGYVTLQIPNSEFYPVKLSELMKKIASSLPKELGEDTSLLTILGTKSDGENLLLNLASPDCPHILIASVSGGGKTCLTRSMIASLVRFNSVKLVLIDPKVRGYSPFSGLYEKGYLAYPIITEPPIAAYVLREIVKEMERRDEERLAPSELTPLLIFIDELVDLLLADEKKEIGNSLIRISQRGRQSRIQLVLSTQKPSAKALGDSGLLRGNIPCRLVGKVVSAEDSKIATGQKQIGCEGLLGRGDFIAILGGRRERFQSAYIEDREIRDLVEGLPSFRERGKKGEPKSKKIISLASLKEAIRKRVNY